MNIYLEVNFEKVCFFFLQRILINFNRERKKEEKKAE
jgi:hypothetical protein